MFAKNKFYISFVIMLLIIFLPHNKAFAYSKDQVSPETLQLAVKAFYDRISDLQSVGNGVYPDNEPIFVTLYYTGSEYRLYGSNEMFSLYPPKAIAPYFTSVYTDPMFFYYEPEDTRTLVTMTIQSSGYFTLPLSGTTAHLPQIIFSDSKGFIGYTNYAVQNCFGVPLRASVPLGSEYRPTASDTEPQTQYSPNTIPTPSNVTIKAIYPKLFQPVESKWQLTWNPTSGALRVELNINYHYKTSNGDVLSKSMPYMTYGSGLFASNGGITKTINEIQDYIHSKNKDTTGKTFANGQLNWDGFSMRYSHFNESTYKVEYGNWVKVTVVTKGSQLDNGNINNEYDEIGYDENGNEIPITDGEYNGVIKDNSGRTVDPTTLVTFTDYILAIPGILSSTFSSLISLTTSIGSMGQIMTLLFAGMNPVIPAMLTAGVGTLVVMGIIKFLK